MSLDRSVAVGVEMGGSRSTAALVDRHGRVLRRCQVKTLRGRPAVATLEPYTRAIDTLLTLAHAERLRICGMGISVPGSLDDSWRRPSHIPTLPSLNGFPLCDFFETRYRLPAHLHTDVEASLLGEQHFGAGQGFRRQLFLTVNAVVGAALVIDGQLDRSAQHSMGHVCHLPVSTSGPRCSCGKRGCINTLVSMEAMQKMVERALRRGDETSLARRLLTGREFFSLQLLAEEAQRGDSVALQVYSEIGRWLGAAVARYVDLFDPHILILGGGVLSAHDLLLPRVRSALTASSSARVCSMVEVVPACLGNDAAMVGTIVPILIA